MKKRKIWIILIVALLVAAGGGYAAYANLGASAVEVTEEPQVQTATVRRGSLIVTADGAGTLTPAEEMEVGFLTAGVLVEVLVEPGDQVQAGDVLARLDDTDARKAVADAELQVAQAEATLAQQQDTTAAEQAVALSEIQVAQAEATLAEQQDTTAAKEAVAQAEIQVAQAEASLASAQLNLEELLTWTPDESSVELAQANLAAAYADYDKVAALTEHTDDQLTQARINLENAQNQLTYAQAAYDQAWDPGRDWELLYTEPTYTIGPGGEKVPSGASKAQELENERESTRRQVESAQLNLEAAQAAYNLAVAEVENDTALKNAWSKVVSAQATLEEAQTGPSESDVEAARLQVQQAELALTQAKLNLEAAQLDLENRDTTQAELSLAQAQLNLAADRLALETWDTTQAELSLAQAQLNLEAAQRQLEETTLIAPVSGTVMAVQAQVGESVGASPIVTLADVEEPQVLFWVEESDLMSVAPGNAVNIVFEALPDYTFPGEIVSVDPALVTVDGTPAVQSWASIDLSAYPVSLLCDMNAEVEIVAGEARNALLVPVQALRELGPDQYAVFVVQSDGELELRPVGVGLKDFVNAEILSGLKAGDVVSTGTAASSDTSTESSTDGEQPPPGIMRFLGGG